MTANLLRRAALAGMALTAGLVLAACGSTTTTNNNRPDMGTAASASNSASATSNDADVTFTQQMIPHHQQAVVMAALADTRASDPEVKKLAAQIKAAQGPEITTMTGWLNAWGKPAPAASTAHGMDMSGGSMPGMMSDVDMTKLGAMSGITFDKQFLLMMIEHHQGAISMSQAEVTGGKNPDTIALAKQIITSQQAEIDTMKTIHARL